MGHTNILFDETGINQLTIPGPLFYPLFKAVAEAQLRTTKNPRNSFFIDTFPIPIP